LSGGEARREAGGPEGLAGGVAHGGSGLGLGRPAALREADWGLQVGVAGSCMAPQDLAGWEAWAEQGGVGRWLSGGVPQCQRINLCLFN